MYVCYEEGRNDLPCIVFIHGDFQNSSVFFHIKELFKNKGHSVLLFDLYGHGLSKSLDQNINIIEFLENTLKNNSIKKPIIFAHSSGGIIAGEYAKKTGNVLSIVALNSPLVNPLYFNKELVKLRDVFKQYSKNGFKKQEYVDYSKIKLSDEEISKIGIETTDPKGFEKNIDYYSNLLINESIFDLDVPFLIISSLQDKLFPFETMKTFAKKLKLAKIIGIDTGHNPLLNNKELIEKLVSENYFFILRK